MRSVRSRRRWLVAVPLVPLLLMPDPGAVAIDLPAPGPLKVHPANRRYFTDGTGRAVYLTGSHTWNVLHDPDPAKSPPFAYGAYLDLLHRHHHNFFRLWARMDTGGGPPAPLPTVYVRTGPGNAQDGLPKYNLERYNDAFLAVRSEITPRLRRMNLREP